MLQRVKEVQESDLRMVGALARNIQRVLAVTQADIDTAAAQGKGWLVKRVVKVNDPLDNLRGGTQLVIKQNSIQPGQNVMRVLYSGNSKTVGPAVAPLSLPGAAADDILSLIAFGGTQQDGVPQEYTRLERLQGDGTAYIDLGITLNQDDEIEVDFIFKYASGSQIFGYRDSASSKNITLFSGGAAGSIFMDFNNSDYTSYRLGTTGTDDAQYTAKISKTKRALYSGTTEIAANSTACPDIFTTGNALLFFAGGSPSGTAKSTGSILEVRIKDRMHLVPAKRNSDDVLGMYDTITGQFFTNAAGSGAFIAGDPMAPTPARPADIVCNNGVLKFTANEANYTADNVTLGYWLRNNNGQPESSPANFYTAMMPVKPNVSYVCFGRNKETDAISGYNRIAWYDADGVWIRNSTYTQNQPGIDVAPSNAAFARFHCNINGTDVTQELVDSYNWVFQQGTAEVPYTPYSPTKVYTAGPIETIAIKDDQDATVSTATCEDLLSVGAYTDEQEIISGVVTRKVGVKVLDGTEDWTYSSGWSDTTHKCFYVTLDDIKQQTNSSNECLCSHFEWYSRDDLYADKTIIGGGISGYLPTNPESGKALTVRVSSSIAVDATAFKSWLAAQYAAGTPVIVVFPLATQTTNTVTPQPMQTAAGDNTAEITQAGMAGLELEVEYVEA